MKTNRVITLARQLGSGGREIGKLLAERLEIPFYDKELLAEAAKQSGLSQTAFEEADEKPTNSFLYSLSVGSHMMAGAYTDYSQFLSNDQLFLKQAEAIRRIAGEGPCVIVGRCADYVLRENPRLTSVYVHADYEAGEAAGGQGSGLYFEGRQEAGELLQLLYGQGLEPGGQL